MASVLQAASMALVVALEFAVTSVAAQGYPNKPVRIVVPTAPGGGVDILSRLLGQKLSEIHGQQFVIDNRPGAGANIGTALVAKSPADGYTLLTVPSSISISASLYKKLPYDAVKDLAPIALVAATPYFVVLHPSVPAASVRELVKLAKSRPGELTYASGGSGTASHLAGEMLKKMAGIDLVHVPYKGVGPAVTDVLAGHVSLFFAGLPASGSHIKAGKLKAIAVADAKRSSLMPQLPTIAEAGYPGYAVENWLGMLAPAGTPADIISRLNGNIVRMLSTAEVSERLAALGFEPVGSTPEQFAAQLKSEIAKWAKVIQETGVRAE
jgi:tripartite-type tricarboxylate transporter receptor subunit TctC